MDDKKDGDCFYCTCGHSWIDNDSLLHDVKCPNCHEYFLDGCIEPITNTESKDISRNEDGGVKHGCD